MGSSGLEPPTSRLSGVRSNRLSYEPIDSGDHLLSQAASHQVPSTAQVLTVVFGMGTGVSPKYFQPILHRKEVIQPHLPIRLPCYDFTPVTGFTFGGSFLTVRSPTSGASNSHGVTGGVYKARERIHRDMLIRDY